MLTTVLLALLLGVVAGAAAVWPFRRKRAPKGAFLPAWEPDPELDEGHRPPDLSALSNQLLGLVRQSVGAQAVVLLRKGESGWKVAAASPGAQHLASAPVPFRQGLVGLAGEADREVLADPVHAESLGYLTAAPGPLSVALVPVTHRGQTAGVLACHRPAGHPFGESDASALKRCARVVLGWEACAAHARVTETVRRQEERVARGAKAMLEEERPDEIAGLLLDSLFDLLPAHYGFVLVAHHPMRFYSVVCKKFAAPESFTLSRETWAHWVISRGGEPLYLEGAAIQRSAMPVLFQGEPFPADRIAFLHPLAAGDARFGVAGVVGRAMTPFGDEDRAFAGALVRQGAALLDRALVHLAHKNLAIRDGLTDLFNRRHLDETLGLELRRALRQGFSCAFILMDLDHFKALNDSHGHEAGDIVLRGVAERVRCVVRDIDIVCRYGGEEFAVILPDCDAAEAARVAERIRQTVADSPFQAGDGLSLPVTVSQGISAFPAPSSTLSTLLRFSDAALYEAKRKGRNRVEIHRKQGL